MNTKHTPGPWVVVETPVENIVSSWHIHIGAVSLPFFPFKRVYSEDRTQSGFVTDKEQHANARLIAAAPDLLEALQMAEGVVAMLGGTPDPEDRFADQLQIAVQKQIRTAILKATGEQQ